MPARKYGRSRSCREAGKAGPWRPGLDGGCTGSSVGTANSIGTTDFAGSVLERAGDGDPEQGPFRNRSLSRDGAEHRRLWRDGVRLSAEPGRLRSMAERVRCPPSRAAADLSDHRQHHLQCRDRVRACRHRLRRRRQAARHRRDRAGVGRLQDHRSVQLARPGHRSHPDRLHQRAPRADPVLQREAARTLQRPHPLDLDGAGDQRLRHHRGRLDLHHPGQQQSRGFRRRLRPPHRCQYRSAVSVRLCRRNHRSRCARLLASRCAATSAS